MIYWPMTKADATKKQYGKWAGFPSGHAYDPERCAAEVWESGRGINHYQCQRKNGHGPEGLFCKQHAKMIEADSGLAHAATD